MASNYPGSLDSFDTIAADKKTSDSVGGRTHRQMHNDLGDAIESVQTELGVNPAGIYDTVAERLAAVDDRVLDGTISDVDINAAADIDPTKIAGVALTRDLVTVDEANDNAMIAGGIGNAIEKVVSRDTHPISAHVEGYNTHAQGWYGHAEGSGSLAEGKISHAEGNNSICAANDSHTEGNRTTTGRRIYVDYSPTTSFSPLATGSEDAGGGLGVLQYVVIPTREGDVTSHFPNPLTDNVEARYGTGAHIDVKGNVYAAGRTSAVWTGDTPSPVNDLEWALHPFCILFGSGEGEWAFTRIAKAVYAGGVTKVYYLGAKPFTAINRVAGSYAPELMDAGNGHHAEGLITSAAGSGAHAEGSYSRAWGFASHAEGHLTRATAIYSHAEGFGTVASGGGSHAEGDQTSASGIGSRATGRESTATRAYQSAYSFGKRVAAGDNQISQIGYYKSVDDAGWHDITVLEALANDRTYLFETTVIGRQTAGSAGAIGHTFAYKFQGAVAVAGGVMTVLGTPTRTLIGRTAAMTGDGLTTGPRLAVFEEIYNGNLALRYDGLANTTFYIATYSTIQELA